MIFNKEGEVVTTNKKKSKPKCFLICPIGDDGSEIRKNSDELMEQIINPACESKGYEIIRADKIKSINKIDDDILYYLNNADLAIADLTGCNPNVFYEIGYRTAKEKPTIYLSRNIKELPFDINHMRVIPYDLNSAEEAKKDISETIDVINIERQTSNSELPPLPIVSTY